MNASQQQTTLSGAGTPELDRALAVIPAGVMRDTFVGAGRDYGPLSIYGGHLLGQALAAAFETVPDNKLAHSLHVYFTRTGAPAAPIGYQVERLRDGRNYTTRLVRAVQDDHTLLVMTASFKTAQPGDAHQPPMPAVAPVTEVLARRRDAGIEPLALPFAAGFGVDIVPLDDWSPAAPSGGNPAITLWMRAALSTGASPRARQCALAYLSDGALMFNALRPHGNAFATHRATSLDHALWFHGDAHPDQWLLFDQSGPAAADSRGLNRGRIYSADGTLVASVAQEAMMRRVS